MRTIIFGYSQLGHDCLKLLCDKGADIVALFTHENNPNEYIWFDSIKDLVKPRGVPIYTPGAPNTPDTIALIKSLDPDFILSLYYRSMICQEILDIPPKRAMNMHGSLLPKYRGRVPANWAIINGETQTGATLHYMVKSADAGDIVDQQAVSILPDDNAGNVMAKITDAALSILDRQWVNIIEGTNPRVPQDHTQATYFGRRTAEDGIIDWQKSPMDIYNLVRALLPYPQYPGAFAIINGQQFRVEKCVILGNAVQPAPPGTILQCDNNSAIVCCGELGHGRVQLSIIEST